MVIYLGTQGFKNNQVLYAQKLKSMQGTLSLEFNRQTLSKNKDLRCIQKLQVSDGSQDNSRDNKKENLSSKQSLIVNVKQKKELEQHMDVVGEFKKKLILQAQDLENLKKQMSQGEDKKLQERLQNQQRFKELEEVLVLAQQELNTQQEIETKYHQQQDQIKDLEFKIQSTEQELQMSHQQQSKVTAQVKEQRDQYIGALQQVRKLENSLSRQIKQEYGLSYQSQNGPIDQSLILNVEYLDRLINVLIESSSQRQKKQQLQDSERESMLSNVSQQLNVYKEQDDYLRFNFQNLDEKIKKAHEYLIELKQKRERTQVQINEGTKQCLVFSNDIKQLEDNSMQLKAQIEKIQGERELIEGQKENFQQEIDQILRDKNELQKAQKSNFQAVKDSENKIQEQKKIVSQFEMEKGTKSKFKDFRREHEKARTQLQELQSIQNGQAVQSQVTLDRTKQFDTQRLMLENKVQQLNVELEDILKNLKQNQTNLQENNDALQSQQQQNQQKHDSIQGLQSYIDLISKEVMDQQFGIEEYEREKIRLLLVEQNLQYLFQRYVTRQVDIGINVQEMEEHTQSLIAQVNAQKQELDLIKQNLDIKRSVEKQDLVEKPSEVQIFALEQNNNQDEQVEQLQSQQRALQSQYQQLLKDYELKNSQLQELIPQIQQLKIQFQEQCEEYEKFTSYLTSQVTFNQQEIQQYKSDLDQNYKVLQNTQLKLQSSQQDKDKQQKTIVDLSMQIEQYNNQKNQLVENYSKLIDEAVAKQKESENVAFQTQRVVQQRQEASELVSKQAELAQQELIEQLNELQSQKMNDNQQFEQRITELQSNLEDARGLLEVEKQSKDEALDQGAYYQSLVYDLEEQLHAQLQNATNAPNHTKASHANTYQNGSLPQKQQNQDAGEDMVSQSQYYIALRQVEELQEELEFAKLQMDQYLQESQNIREKLLSAEEELKANLINISDRNGNSVETQLSQALTKVQELKTENNRLKLGADNRNQALASSKKYIENLLNKENKLRS